MVDVLSGQVPVYFGNLNELLPHLASGRIRVLAVSGGKRASQLPNVPTVAEQGYPGFRTETWNGVAAPAGTAQEIVERLAREIALGCRDAGFVGRLDRIGVDADPVEPADEAGVPAPERDLARQALDDLLRCAGGRRHAVPGLGAEAGITLLGDRRHIGKLRRTLAARHGEHADAAGCQMGNQFVEV